MNEDLQNMPIISSLQYIFKNADYTNGIFKLRGNLASKGFIDLENPKNIFIFILDNINNEIGGGFNPNQSNSSFLSKHSNNKNKLYEDFVNQIFTPLNHTFISNNFFGIREVISKCNTCKYENYNLDIFRFLEFSVEEVQKFLVNKLPDYIQGEKSNPKRFLEINYNNVKIVHRVVEKVNVNGEIRYFTKGDINKEYDPGYRTKKDIIGIKKLKIKYVGIPTLWLHELFN